MSEPDVLRRIALHTEKRVARLKAARPAEQLRREPLYARAPRDFAVGLVSDVDSFDPKGQNCQRLTPPRIIAEVKFASPSEGFLRPDPGPEEAARLAGRYLDCGAAAVSILTERHFFAGAPEFLGAARRARPDALLLMKDFMLDDYQFELARAEGADCVLLIAALLGPALPAMLARAQALGLSALVEVHCAEELEAAVEAGAALIGVNSRNLRTLKTDLAVARSLAGRAPGAVMIAESGLTSRAELDELSALGYRGFLIGTSLMRQPDPGEALRGFLR